MSLTLPIGTVLAALLVHRPLEDWTSRREAPALTAAVRRLSARRAFRMWLGLGAFTGMILPPAAAVLAPAIRPGAASVAGLLLWQIHLEGKLAGRRGEGAHAPVGLTFSAIRVAQLGWLTRLAREEDPPVRALLRLSLVFWTLNLAGVAGLIARSRGADG